MYAQAKHTHILIKNIRVDTNLDLNIRMLVYCTVGFTKIAPLCGQFYVTSPDKHVRNKVKFINKRSSEPFMRKTGN